MTTRSPIETTTRYATTVDSLSDAWAFVMAYVDRVGARPRVVISPVTSFSAAFDDEAQEYFEVVVSGMVEEER